MHPRATDKKFEALLQAARDVCEVSAELTQAKAAGELTPASEARISSDLYALEVRLEWLKQMPSAPRTERMAPVNLVNLPWAGLNNHNAKLRRVQR